MIAAVYPGAEETILALASPAGHAPLGIARVSGPEAFPLVAAICAVPPPFLRGIHPIELSGLAAATLSAMVILLPGPGSFTGEDTAEIVTVGNPLILDRVIEMLLHAARTSDRPARRARAGEFSARAFLNGRITAEETLRIPLLLSAEQMEDVRSLSAQRRDDRASAASEWREQLANLLALVEASIDFTDEEDVVAISAGRLVLALTELADSMGTVLNEDRPREAPQQFPRIVLFGAPNAGKSTLFNALLGHSRVVTSPIAGATRDVIEEYADMGDSEHPCPVLLVDTAGTEEQSHGPGALPPDIAAARRHAIERADLALLCRAPGQSAVPAPREGTPVLHVRTMRDLREGRHEEDREDVARVSARTGAGLGELRARIRAALEATTTSAAARAVSHRSVDQASLKAARDLIRECRDAAARMAPAEAPSQPELIAHLLRRALDHLGAVAGHASPDDVLGRIFSTFCIGK